VSKRTFRNRDATPTRAITKIRMRTRRNRSQIHANYAFIRSLPSSNLRVVVYPWSFLSLFLSSREALNPKDGEDIHTRARAKIRRTRTRDRIIRAKIGRRAVRIFGTNQKNAENMNIETRTCHSSFRAYEISVKVRSLFYNFLEKKKRREKKESKKYKGRASERGSLALEDKERSG